MCIFNLPNRDGQSAGRGQGAPALCSRPEFSAQRSPGQLGPGKKICLVASILKNEFGQLHRKL